MALAVLLASREAMSPTRLAEVLDSTAKEVEAGLAQLAQDLRAQGMPLELLAVDDAYRIATAPAVYPYLVRLKKLKKAERLTPAALETLAVIAYRQPVIRAEIEAIRGVKAGPVLKSLLDHKLVKAVGRADVPGRPLQYGTTQTFLDRFGLRSLDDLPSIQELRTLG
ncbi:MAG: SMC-Scp complex subunit ScpB [Planctomycetota bacterium]